MKFIPYLIFYNCNIVFPTDDESGEKAVSVLLSGEESELIFIDHAYTEMNVSKIMLKMYYVYKYIYLYILVCWYVEI